MNKKIEKISLKQEEKISFSIDNSNKNKNLLENSKSASIIKANPTEINKNSTGQTSTKREVIGEEEKSKHKTIKDKYP